MSNRIFGRTIRNTMVRRCGDWLAELYYDYGIQCYRVQWSHPKEQSFEFSLSNWRYNLNEEKLYHDIIFELTNELFWRQYKSQDFTIKLGYY